MKKHTKSILTNYDDQKQLYTDFNNKCRQLIIDLLSNADIKHHQITDRIKDKTKLESKIVKKSHKYTKLSEITDVCGIRIITYFEDEVDKIAEIIKLEFNVDSKNSIDKRQLETDRFGYRSLHYVVSLKENRARLAEYKKYADLKVEIQIRTILQHSWAEIEHDIGYKGEIAIPDFAKRTFYRVAALLETADLEFVSLKNTLKDYEDKVKIDIVKTPENVVLDQASLASYIKTSSKIAELDKQFSGYLKVPLVNSPEESAKNLLTRLKVVGITTIKQLDDVIQNHNDELYKIYKEDCDNDGDAEQITGVARGVAIYQVDHFLKHSH